jgi:hypothetical protein
VNPHRLQLDPFSLALGALLALAAAFFATRNGAALIMCALCVAGLLAGRAAGFSNRALLPLAVGLGLILWMVWVDPPTTARRTSALAHAAGGALVGWALAEYLSTRIPWPRWGITAVVAVLALTVLWELGELAGDVVLTTSLRPDSLDSLLDIGFGTLGGVVTVGLARLLKPRPGTVIP